MRCRPTRAPRGVGTPARAVLAGLLVSWGCGDGGRLSGDDDDDGAADHLDAVPDPGTDAAGDADAGGDADEDATAGGDAEWNTIYAQRVRPLL